MLSDWPMEVEARIIGARHARAHTVCRVCANTAFTPSALTNVVFPDMFEPVINTPAFAIESELATGAVSKGCRRSWTDSDFVASENSGTAQVPRVVRQSAIDFAASIRPIDSNKARSSS